MKDIDMLMNHHLFSNGNELHVEQIFLGTSEVGNRQGDSCLLPLLSPTRYNTLLYPEFTPLKFRIHSTVI